MRRRILVPGLLAVLGCAAVVVPWVSRHPDGLERVAQDQGFARREQAGAWGHCPLSGYIVPGMKDTTAVRIGTGAAGILMTAAVAGGIGALVRHRRKG